MSRSLSWIDPDAVQSALSRAYVPPGSGRPAAPRFSPPPPSEPPELPRPTAVPASAPPSVAPTSAPQFRGTLTDRVRSLAVWVEAELGPARWFLADDEGLPLHSAGASDTQVITPVALARALRPLRGFLGTDRVHAVSLELGAGRTLHVVWCDTGIGRVAMGLEDPRGMSRDTLRELRDAIRAALDG